MRTYRLSKRTGWAAWLGSALLSLGCGSSQKTGGTGGMGAMDAGMPDAGPACGPVATIPFAPATPGTFSGKAGAACTRDIDCVDGTFCTVVFGTCANPAMLQGTGKGGHLSGGGACLAEPAFPSSCDPLALDWSAPIDVSKNKKALGESDTAVLSNGHGTVLVAWADDVSNGNQYNGLAVSSDDGKSFAQIAAPVHSATGDENDAVLALDDKGLIYYVWEGFDAKFAGAQHIWSATSHDGHTWSTPLQVDTMGDDGNGTIPLDFPALAINPVNGNPYYTYQITAASGPIPLKLVVGASGGATVAPSVELDDGTRQGSFRDLARGAFDAKGSFYVAWHEETGSGGSTGQGLESGDAGNAVYFTRVDLAPGGGLAPLGHDVKVTGMGEAVHFGIPQVQVTKDGSTVFIVYEAGTKNAIDVKLVTSHDKGLTFGPPVKINDDATCATHYHAASALDAKGRLWVLWYDNRDGAGHVVYSVTDDGGKTFHPNRLVTPYAFPFETFQYSVGWLGDYFGLATSGGAILAAWSDPHDGGQSHVNFARATLPP